MTDVVSWVEVVDSGVEVITVVVVASVVVVGSPVVVGSTVVVVETVSVVVSSSVERQEWMKTTKFILKGIDQ